MSETQNSDSPAEGKSDDELSYEAAREELISVVGKLEAGGASLAESMELWQRGEKLATICQKWLDGAKEKIEAARAETAERGD